MRRTETRCSGPSPRPSASEVHVAEHLGMVGGRESVDSRERPRNLRAVDASEAAPGALRLVAVAMQRATASKSGTGMTARSGGTTGPIASFTARSGDRFPPRRCFAVMPGVQAPWGCLEDHLRPRCQDGQPLSFSASSVRYRSGRLRQMSTWPATIREGLWGGAHDLVTPLTWGHWRARCSHGKRENRDRFSAPV
jgi:hypothetical protein